MTEIEARDLFGPFEDEEKVTPEKRMGNNVSHPDHYNTGEVECIDAIQSCMAGLSGFEGFCTGNAIKYLWRWRHKGGKEDILKAAWYLNRLAHYVEEKNAH